MTITYDFHALEAKIGIDQMEWADHPTEYMVARLGIHRKQIERYRFQGMDTFAADRVALKAGYHPVDIWPSWYGDALDANRCGWCADPSDTMVCSSPECRRELKNERHRDKVRLRDWWERVDGYRETVEPEGSAVNYNGVRYRGKAIPPHLLVTGRGSGQSLVRGTSMSDRINSGKAVAS